MDVQLADDVRRRRRVGLVPLLFALAAMVVAGCGDDSDDASDTTSSTTNAATSSTATTVAGAAAVAAADLDGRTFLSTTVTGQDLVADSVIRLSFDGSTLAVNAGCNTITSEYAVDETGLLAWTDEAAATMMNCLDDYMAQDAWLTELFTDGVLATLDGATLTLTSSDLTIELDEEVDSEVLGTTWTLDGLIQDDSVSSLPQGVEAPTIEIAEDGNATVFAGCNNGGTKVTVGDTTVTFEPMRLTRMACEGDASTVEAAVVAVMDGEVEMVVRGETLTLTKGTQGLVFRAS